jgi:Icc-related predicted phosphoesterase
MKIALASDLHLEFGYQSLLGGDVLILAGDVCEYRTLSKRRQNVAEFFEIECAKYTKVFMVMGNHEHYHHRLDKTYTDLKGILPSNVTLLENESVEYEGIVFVGSTLWTDCNRNDPMTIMVLKDSINDYRTITNYYSERDAYGKLNPVTTYQLHQNTTEYFKQELPKHQNKPVVMITHHAPTFMSIHERYASDRHMNGGYASDLSSLILDNPQIKLWVHGHVHDPFDYQVGNTRVACNPRGYVGHESQANDFKIMDLEV